MNVDFEKIIIKRFVIFVSSYVVFLFVYAITYLTTAYFGYYYANIIVEKNLKKLEWKQTKMVFQEELLNSKQ